ncbi:hypothetical protein B0H12DRAFT_961995, partial [Mycena haematopus]
LLAVLVQHSARWGEVRLHGPLSWLSDLACIRGNLPRLRKLRSSFWPHLQEEPEPLLDSFELAPSLREAIVH